MLVRWAGGRPILAVGFMMVPSLYVTLCANESLVLSRATTPGRYEATLGATLGSLPLLALPPSLRCLLGAPLLLPRSEPK